MSELWASYATRRPVALALACCLVATVAAFSPAAHAAPSSGNTLTGPVRVVDGDTLDIAGQRVRLEGIDAPEMGQTCARRWFMGTWDCGGAAAKALQALVKGQAVTCENRGADKYGRMLGVCFAGDLEINKRLVRDGHAWAFVKYSAIYVADEAEARAARRGVFASTNDPPWVYRSRQWASAEQQAPTGCAIKGNVTRNGRIYHMPWSPWYAKVMIDEARGERWFCSEADAIAHGWRAAHGS